MTKEQEARLIEAMTEFEQDEYDRDESYPWTLDEIEDGRVALAYCEFDEFKNRVFATEQAWYNIKQERIEYEVDGVIIKTEPMAFDDLIASLERGLYEQLVNEMDSWIRDNTTEKLVG